MATLKFMRIVSKIRLRCTSPIVEQPENLREEVRFLKDILHMKRFGGGFSELAYKVKLLQKENSELKKKAFPQDRIALILQQNKSLKSQLELMKKPTNLRFPSSEKLNQGSDSEEAKEENLGPYDSYRKGIYSQNRFYNRFGSTTGYSDLKTKPLISEELKPNNLKPKNLNIIFTEKLPKLDFMTHNKERMDPRGRSKNNNLKLAEEENKDSNNLSPLLPLKKNNFINLSNSRNKSTSSFNSDRDLHHTSGRNDTGLLMGSLLSKTQSQPLKVIHSAGRFSKNSGNGSPVNLKDYQGILELIENHAGKLELNRVAFSDKKSYPNLEQDNNYLEEPRQSVFSGNDEPEVPDYKIKSYFRTKAILKQIQIITSKNKESLHSTERKSSNDHNKDSIIESRDYRSKIIFSITPRKFLKVSLNNSKAHGSQLPVSTNDCFSLAKYDQNIKNMKREMDQINFD